MGRPGRLPNFDYSSGGCYFVTFCTRNRKRLLSTIVGRDDLGAPQIMLHSAGKCLDGYICSIPKAYPNVIVDKYVIMPNHVHMLISVSEVGAPGSSRPTAGSSRPTAGSSRPTAGSSRPTGGMPRATQLIPRIISALKRFTNRDMGENLWQSTYHDHIIRNEEEYLEIWNYIDGNSAKWEDDCYYKEA